MFEEDGEDLQRLALNQDPGSRLSEFTGPQIQLKDAKANDWCCRPVSFSHAISGGEGVAARSVS
jgi:hypothetical protein